MAGINKGRSDLERLVVRKVGLTLFFLVILFGVLGVLGLRFETQMIDWAVWVNETFGFPALGLILFASDALLSPLPPDLILFVISRSPLKEMWWLYVGILGVISFLGGVTGSYIGRFLGQAPFVQRSTQKFRLKYEPLIEKYALGIIALGALTPLPFSVTCWSAGILKVPVKTIALASLLRIPRFLGVYLVLYYSSYLKTWMGM